MGESLVLSQELTERSLDRPLTPRCKEVVEQLVATVTKDPSKKACIERACPNWRQNTQLPFLYEDPNDLQSAFERVQKSREDLDRMKERILQAFEDRSETLQLFQKSIKASLDKHTEEKLLDTLY